MEHIDGTSLDEVLRSRDRMASSDAVRVAIDVAEALLFASRRKLPGFFLAPERIVFSSRGEVKILPPDAVPSNAPAPDEAYVLRATGVLLYAILTGGKVQNLPSLLSPRVSRISGLSPIREMTRSVPQGLASVVDGLLGLPSRHSFTRVERAIAELRRLLQVQERTESRTHSASLRAEKRRRRSHLRLLAAIGVLAVVLVGIIFMLIQRGRQKELIRDEFEQAQLAFDAELVKFTGARKTFLDTPTDRNAEMAKRHLENAKNALVGIIGTHPHHELTAVAKENVAKIESVMRKFEDQVDRKVYDMAATRDLAKLDEELERELAALRKKGRGQIDTKRWAKKYGELLEKHSRSERGQIIIRNRVDRVARLLVATQFEIDARTVDEETASKLERQHRFGAAIEAWDEHLNKYRKYTFLQYQAYEAHGAGTNRIKRTARGMCRLLIHEAKTAAANGNKAKAREILQGIVSDFGIDEFVSNARRELQKIGEG
jgi:hypothetical protein